MRASCAQCRLVSHVCLRCIELQRCSPAQVAVDEYLPALLQLRVLIPAIEGARSFEILPRHGIEGRAIQVVSAAACGARLAVSRLQRFTGQLRV